MDKQTFFESINVSSNFNEEFYKKVYGYSICDSGFLPLIRNRFVEMERPDLVKSYNEWFTRYQYVYKHGDGKHEGMIEVSRWYSKICEEQFEELKRVRQAERESEVKTDWKQQEKADLLQKKKELLQKKLLLSIGK